MAQTPEQRAANSRANGARSRGPKTEAGKIAASRNSLKHGMTARKLTLPNEDPEALAGRTDEWVDHFQPASPDACHLLDECVRATIRADRYHRAHDTAVAEQMHKAEAAWEKQQLNRVKALRERLIEDPVDAFAELRSFPHGCRWLIGRLGHYRQILETRGYWIDLEIDEVVRLYGARPGYDELGQNEEAYLLTLFALRCQPVFGEASLGLLLRPERRPERLRDWDGSRLVLAPAECLGWLKHALDELLEMLRGDEARQRAGSEAAERSRRLDPLSVLRDPGEARLFARYQSEYRSTFHRAHKGLMGVLKRDAEHWPPSGEARVDEETAGVDPRNEPEPTAEIPTKEEVASVEAVADSVSPGPNAGHEHREGTSRAGNPGGHEGRVEDDGRDNRAVAAEGGVESRNEPRPETETLLDQEVASSCPVEAFEAAGGSGGDGSSGPGKTMVGAVSSFDPGLPAMDEMTPSWVATDPVPLLLSVPGS